MTNFLWMALLAIAPGLPAQSKPVLVMVIAEDEYKTDTTLPAFAKSHLAEPFDVKLVTADPKNKHRLLNLEQLAKADVMLLSVRRRPLHEDDLKLVKAYFAAKKPVVALRTASHAWAARKGDKLPAGVAEWPKFDAEILGCHYANHYPHKVDTKLTHAPGRSESPHAIVADVPAAGFISKSGLYKSAPLEKDCVPLLIGTSGEHPPEPVAWLREATAERGKVVYIALAHTSDFDNEVFPKVLANACTWAVKK